MIFNLTPKGQKYCKGTLVWIAKDLGPYMGHFKSNRVAIVLGSYKEFYGSDDVKSYKLLIRYDDGKWWSVAWYKEHQIKIYGKAMCSAYRIANYKKELSEQGYIK